MPVETKTTWLAVGDGEIAQFYSVHAIPLRLTKVPAGTLKASRKVTRGPEHKGDRGGATHGNSSHGDHVRHENVFIEHVAEALGTAARDGEFDYVIVVLPPRALAHFRKVAPADVRKRIKQEIRGDWTKLKLPEITRHLAAHLE